mmetsp:Transcript_277/g.841  ORF Transcript_277/g.841 Transcript_277/m.841 type:complete len:276 (-) Transcript_277:75-902(-)
MEHLHRGRAPTEEGPRGVQRLVLLDLCACKPAGAQPSPRARGGQRPRMPVADVAVHAPSAGCSTGHPAPPPAAGRRSSRSQSVGPVERGRHDRYLHRNLRRAPGPTQALSPAPAALRGKQAYLREQPPRAFIHALVCAGGARLHVPVPVPDGAEVERLHELVPGERVHDILLVGEDEHWEARGSGLREHAAELSAGLLEAAPVRAVDDEDDAHGALRVGHPVVPHLGGAADVNDVACRAGALHAGDGVPEGRGRKANFLVHQAPHDARLAAAVQA